LTKRILLLAVLFLSVSGATKAEEGQLGVTLDLTYASRWMSRGRQVWGDTGGFFETIDLDLWSTGFGAAVIHRSATGSGWVSKQRYDYMLYYGGTVLDNQGDSFLTSGACLTKYKVSWIYKHYYTQPCNYANVQAWIFSFSWPKILNMGSLVPYYVATDDYPAGSGYKAPSMRDFAGWVHRFGLGYDLELPELPAPLHLTSDIAFTDGFRTGVDHDWSHATFGVSTKLEITDNLSFVPGVYQQITMDKSVNPNKDVTYCILSMKYKF